MAFVVDGDAGSAASTSNYSGDALDRGREPFSTRGNLQATPNPIPPRRLHRPFRVIVPGIGTIG